MRKTRCGLREDVSSASSEWAGKFDAITFLSAVSVTLNPRVYPAVTRAFRLPFSHRSGSSRICTRVVAVFFVCVLYQATHLRLTCGVTLPRHSHRLTLLCLFPRLALMIKMS